MKTTIMYEKETLRLKIVRQMLHNNELMKKTNSTEETSRLIVKEQRGDHRVDDPKRAPKLLVETPISIIANNQGT